MVNKMNEIRPIDASELLSKAEIAPMYAVDAMVCYNLIESAPTLDYAAVIHAHWIWDEYTEPQPICSNCKREPTGFYALIDYCQHCGAKMDEYDLE